MKKFLPILSLLNITKFSFAQVSGTKTIPGDYATIAAAFAALNTNGVGAGGVTFNIAAGYTETGYLSLTVTGTAANPIVFQKSGVGANPTITAGVGTGYDCIIKLTGSDHVTIDGLTLLENFSNTTNTTRTECGIAFFKPNNNNGCQYNTIKNCTISLNGTYQDITNTNYRANAILLLHGTNPLGALLGLSTTAAGGNSFNSILNNTITNATFGVNFRNQNSITVNFSDERNSIVGNSISNIGGHTSPAGCIDLDFCSNTSIVGNTLSTNVTHRGILSGINIIAIGKSGLEVLNNTIQINNGVSLFAQYGIFTQSSTSFFTTNSYGDFVNIKGNTISSGSVLTGYQGITVLHSQNTSILQNTISFPGNIYNGASIGISLNSSFTTNATHSIRKNILQNNLSSTAQVTGIIAIGNALTCFIDSNRIINNNASIFKGFTTNMTTTNLIISNNIVSCNSTNIVGEFTGMQVGTTAELVYNNFINCQSTTDATYRAGIAVGGTSTVPQLYHNTIYLAGAATNIISSCLRYNSGQLQIFNNIFVNKIVPGISGRSTALFHLNATSFSSKNNLFYAGTPSAKNLIYATANIATPTVLTAFDSAILDYKLRICGDMNSVTDDVPFISLDENDPNFLHINATIPCLANNNGFAIPTIVPQDVDNEIRSTTTPDIGADELNGTKGVANAMFTKPQLWLKADRLVYNYSGTLATDGQQVGNWTDLSCNAQPATQPTSTFAPTWQRYAFNGKPALYFDGVNGNYWLQGNSAPVAVAGSARTYFVVAKAACNATGYTGGFLFSNKVTANVSAIEFTKNGTGIYHGDNFCCNHPEVTSVAFESGQNQPFVGSWRTGGTGTNLDFWFNGASQITANANFVEDNGINAYAIGNRLDGAPVTSDNDWQGHIAEVIVYDIALTDAERIAVEAYLTAKYITSATTAQFTGLPTTSFLNSNTTFTEATWKHTFNSGDISKAIVSVKDNCLSLGTINSTVYNDANATLNGGKYTMRRHYVVKPTLSPVGTKRVRLYYTDADFANLQAFVLSLISASELVVTKYSGPNENGVYGPTGGTLEFIPSSQITTGTSFGQNFLEFDITSFSEFWIHTGSSVLPISLTSFTATEKNNKALLTWNTASELNNKGYNIQHSTNGASFSDIAFVNGKGNSTTNTNYNFTHYKPPFGKNYYRLQALDFDGKTTLSNIEIVEIKSSKEFIRVYPNPTSELINVTSNKKISSLELFDIMGRKLKSFTPTQSSVDVGFLTNGMYVLKVVLASGDVVEERIMVRK